MNKPIVIIAAMDVEYDFLLEKLDKVQVKQIAEQKMPDLNAASIETAMSMVEGTARAMGVVVVD